MGGWADPGDGELPLRREDGQTMAMVTVTPKEGGWADAGDFDTREMAQ